LSGSEQTFRCDNLQAFLPKDYIVDGVNDIGAIGFECASQEAGDLSFQTLQIGHEDPFDTSYFGRSSEFVFRGQAFFTSSRDRVGLSTHSKPGCSGTPLYSENGHLRCILHGEAKHRGGILHSASINSKEISSFVYVDLIRECCRLEYWNEELIECVYHLENLSLNEMENPDKFAVTFSVMHETDSFNYSEGMSDDAKTFCERAIMILNLNPETAVTCSILDLCQTLNTTDHHNNNPCLREIEDLDRITVTVPSKERSCDYPEGMSDGGKTFCNMAIEILNLNPETAVTFSIKDLCKMLDAHREYFRSHAVSDPSIPLNDAIVSKSLEAITSA